MNDDEERNVDKQSESMVASYRYLEVSIRAYKLLGAMSVMSCSVCKGLIISIISEEFLHSTILRPALRQLDSCQPSPQYA